MNEMSFVCPFFSLNSQENLDSKLILMNCYSKKKNPKHKNHLILIRNISKINSQNSKIETKILPHAIVIFAS